MGGREGVIFEIYKEVGNLGGVPLGDTLNDVVPLHVVKERQ